MKTVEFYYDFVSPASFLGYHRLKQIAEKQTFTIVYKPVLLGALMKAAGNSPPFLVASKGIYLNTDLTRFAKRYGVAYELNAHFPMNCIKQLRGAIFMEGNKLEELYRETIFNAVWQEGKNIADENVFKEVLTDAGIDSSEVLLGIENEQLKQTLKDNTAEAFERGAFGVPTFYVDGEMFFGQDRLDFVEEIVSV